MKKRRGNGSSGTIIWSDEELERAFWTGCPWIHETLTKPDRDLALEATRKFAGWWFARTPVSLDPQVCQQEVDHFVGLLESGVTVGRLLQFGGPVRMVAWTLQELTRAKALQLWKRRLEETSVEDEDPISSRPTRELRVIQKLFPGVHDAGSDRSLHNSETSLLWRTTVIALTRSRGRGHVPWPQSIIGAAVDSRWEAPQAERNVVIAGLVREVLEIPYTPRKARELLKRRRSQTAQEGPA